MSTSLLQMRWSAAHESLPLTTYFAKLDWSKSATPSRAARCSAAECSNQF